jgi:hypothetical protein
MEAAKENGYSEFDLYLLEQQITTNTKLTDEEQKLLYKKLSELQPLDNSVGVFFTGHRPSDLWGYKNMDPYRKLFINFTDVLRELSKKHNNIVVYVGGAQGVDMIAQEAAVALGLPVVLCRPSSEYNKKWKNDGGFFGKDAFEKRTKNASLNNSLREVIVSDRNDVSSLEIRNMYMANHCHICIACKIPQKTSGGTYNAWRYAKNAGLEIVLIDPFEGENQVIPAPLISAEKDFLAKFPHFPNRSTESEKHCLLPLAARVPAPATPDSFII